jgi:DNA-binding beta-propeller fold protein YncE
MRARSVRLALAVAVLGTSVLAATADAQDLLYVASQEAVTVAVIDMTTNELVETVDLKALGYSATAKAHDTAVEPDGSFWYVSLIAAGKVLKFDRNNRLVGETDFETPGLLSLDPESDLLYVGRSMAAVNPPQRVGVITRSSMEIEEVDVFFARPHAIAVDPRGERFFSASLGQNSVAWAPVGAEDVDLLPLEGPNHVLVQFAVSGDGRWMVAGGQMSGELLVFDLTGDAPRVVNSMHVGGQPWHPTFSPDGLTVWVPNQSANTVTVVDTRSWTVSDVIEHPALAEPHGSAISPDGKTVYVSGRNLAGTYHPADGGDSHPGTVVAIDAASHEVVAVIEVGEYAAGMSGPTSALFPDTGYVRHVAGIPFVDESGTTIEQPFLGGFNIPRPQLVDIDADGDDDLFIQETSGSVMFFEHVAGATPQYQWRTDRYQDLEVGEWYRFVDLDRDGDPDLLAERPFSYLRYYRNDGTPEQPRFVEAADSLKDTDGRALFSDRQNIPNATDIDCDGQMDLLIGRLEGTVTRYEETGTDENGVPRFVHVTDRFEGISIVAQIGSLHGANTMALGDVDGDGDEDMFWGDYFEPGILFIENTGSCRSPSLRSEPVPFPAADPLKTSGYNAPTVGDVDGDGDQDLLVGVLGGAYNPNTTTADNLHYLEQVGSQPARQERTRGAGRTARPVFEHRSSRFLSTLDFGAESIPVVVDLDGDGDLDLLVGNKIEQDDTQNGKLYRLMNDGTASRPSFRLDGDLDVGGGYHLLPAFGDLDGDGDLDAILGTWSDELRLLRNDATDGSISLTAVDSAVVTLTRGRNATPTLGDIDGDGDLDLMIGESSGTLNFYENTGTPTRAEFTLRSDEYGDIDVGRRSLPLLHDIDDDGDLDLVVGSENEGVHLYRNEGSTSAPHFTDAGKLGVADLYFAAPVFVDLDGDGDDDVLVGGAGGGLLFFENRGR